MNEREPPSSTGRGEPDPGELALARGLRELPEAIEPQRDLWPRIAARLAPREDRSERSGWQNIAAAVALMAVSSIATLLWAERDDLPALPAGGLAGDYQLPGTAFLQARASLTIDVEARLDRLPLQTQVQIRENLAQIQQAVGQIRLALARDPDNVLLQQLLLATYQQELNVLNDLTQAIENASETRIET